MLSKDNGMVATSMPEAADAGLRVLRSGGNAVDAAVATSLAIAVVDPADSGLGGAGIATIYQHDSDEVLVVDFNAVCPRGVSPSTYQLLDGISPDTGYRRVKDDANVRGYRSISVPGQLAGLDLLVREYGTRRLRDLVGPAIDLARDGFHTNRFVAEAVDWNLETMVQFPDTSKIFAPRGRARVGDLLVQKDLCASLKLVSREGRDAFYAGDIGAKVLEAMEDNGGLITGEDLSGYAPRVVKPATTNYRGYEVSVPPAGSGGNALLEALNILENFELAPLGYYSPEMVHLLIETLKLTWADRLVCDADPDFVPVPLRGLLSKQYAKSRSKEIDVHRVIGRASAGDPWKYEESRPRNAPRRRRVRLPRRDTHTTQITAVDKDRNMVSLTQTIWGTFGSFVTIPSTGILMNNGQTRFDPEPASSNRPEPGKRVLSNMCPMVVTKDGAPVLAAGTPGGRRIIATLLSFLVGFVDYGVGTDGLNMPRLHCETAEPVLIESSWAGAPLGTVRTLEKQGHRLQLLPVSGAPYLGYTSISGPASAIAVKGRALSGTADSRQPGAIRGY